MVTSTTVKWTNNNVFTYVDEADNPTQRTLKLRNRHVLGYLKINPFPTLNSHTERVQLKFNRRGECQKLISATLVTPPS